MRSPTHHFRPNAACGYCALRSFSFAKRAILPTLLSLYVNIRGDSDFITQQHFRRTALPAPIPGSADKKGAGGIDVKL